MKKIQVGIIGFGMAGRIFHAPFIDCNPGFTLKAIRETQPENVEYIRMKYPDAVVVDNVLDILNNPKIKLVVIAVPNHLHFQLAEQALHAGKHVVVEKPFTVTSKEADILIKLAVEKKLLLTVYHNRRWDSDFLTIKKVIVSGVFGTVVEYEGRFERFRNFIKANTWKELALPGTGLLYDLGSHLIDQALCLFGLPVEVTAHLGYQREGSQIIDNFNVRLTYSNVVATLKGGMLMREPGIKYLLYGSNGSVVKYGIDVQEDDLKAGLTPLHKQPWGVEPEVYKSKFSLDMHGLNMTGVIASENGNYGAFYDNLYSAIKGEAPLAVTALQAQAVIKVIEMAIQSHEQKATIAYRF